ncbi:phosphoribosylformylglycinamidine synthase I [Fluviispira sanaruensis]|uniref:Phosphoribosylformylglycinamidine synthase subunit PurQ n=1 Tax=Fluviispira sanaruensis TaxID=2493639 RepID=A0A4P2VLA0_FLUSA|nr:phosphoribosylformylglycinamidine synthase I [Fluviispira sanaruensis]BBH52724.1 phosphoribosylformylglycinamidine synthase subunit PurQ [Fluviispira sanaruensis]
MKKTLLPVFPGTNCEKESLLWIASNLETEAEFLDLAKHSSLKSEEIDAIFVPGGFSYGDYLRAGAIAARSEEMAFVKKRAAEGVAILGICNGFQILCETGLLPGALVKNITRRYHHFPVSIHIDSAYLNKMNSSKKCVWIPEFNENEQEELQNEFSTHFRVPLSCGMGNWLPPVDEIARSQAVNNAVIYYNHNENGSYKSIAGITNDSGTVLGMMPHPERASDTAVGGTDGLIFLLGISQSRNIKIRVGSELEKFVEKIKMGRAH